MARKWYTAEEIILRDTLEGDGHEVLDWSPPHPMWSARERGHNGTQCRTVRAPRVSGARGSARTLGGEICHSDRAVVAAP